jgi:hypothetical protein
MFHPLDIFKTDSDGSVLWRGSAETFTAAKAWIQKLAASAPGEYLILDQYTGQRVLVTGIPCQLVPPETRQCEMKIDLRE